VGQPTKPWTVTLKQRIAVDVELIDEICAENEQSLKHILASARLAKVASIEV